MTIRIAMWSGPRNISTAMMRAWENRADTVVLDEPFYGAYLACSGAAHPMREVVLATMPTDWAAAEDACLAPVDAAIQYQKQMCQHMLEGLPERLLRACRHAFLVRPPEEVAPSFFRAWPEAGLDDLGFAQQAALFDRVAEATGQAPPVIEARDVLERPEAMLRALSAALGVAFDPAMLSWPPGPRGSDGAWAPHWYDAVRRSTGFAPPRPPNPVPAALEDVVERCRPHYQHLARHRLVPVEA